jgi:hypothetical protein
MFNFVIVIYVLFGVFCVLFVCKCELYCCHRVSTQLQFYIYIYIKLYIKLRCHHQGAFLVPSERCSIEKQSIEYCGWACSF